MGVSSQGLLQPGWSRARLFIQPLIIPKLLQPPRILLFPLEQGAERGRQQTEREDQTRREGHVWQEPRATLKVGRKLFLNQRYPPSSPKASSPRARPPPKVIGRRRDNRRSDWTRRIFLCRDVSHFLVLHWPLVERLRKSLEKRFPVGSPRFGFPRIS